MKGFGSSAPLRPTGNVVTLDEYDVISRNSLPVFIERVFAQLDPQTPFAPNWHIDLLAHKLTQVANGVTRRLIINVPPRSLKSICASVAKQVWTAPKPRIAPHGGLFV